MPAASEKYIGRETPATGIEAEDVADPVATLVGVGVSFAVGVGVVELSAPPCACWETEGVGVKGFSNMPVLEARTVTCAPVFETKTSCVSESAVAKVCGAKSTRAEPDKLFA